MADTVTVVQILIAVGATVMFGSALYTRQLLGQLDETGFRRRWQVLFALMVAFLFGYVAALEMTIVGYEQSFRVLAGAVFLFGAGFVFLVVDTGLRTVGELQDKRDSLENTVEEAETARQYAAGLQEEAELFNRHLEEKAGEYREVMEACEEGDLSRRMDPSSRSDAMADIARSFNEMVAEMDETIERVRVFATNVASASEDVSANAEEIRTASRSVSESIQEISEGTDHQNEQFQQVSAEIEALSTAIDEIATTSSDVADLANWTARLGREGRDSARSAIEGMSQIEDTTAVAVEEIERLEAQIEQIDELMEFIKEVAQETNQLALNANIEASRADSEEAQGFAAVATEIKGMAADTKEAADDVETRIENIKEQSAKATSEVHRASAQVGRQADSVREAAEALDTIADNAEATNDGIQEIADSTESQATSTDQVLSLVQEAGSIADETATEADHVAAAAQEQTSAITEVSNNLETLTTQAAELDELLDRFRTEHEPDRAETRSG
jgi:methyl-accepting chemotaxis protein